MKRSKISLLGVIAGLMLILNIHGVENSGGVKPSILFCSPDGLNSFNLHIGYVKELHDKGFEVDYTENKKEMYNLTPERINKYNVVVIYVTPGGSVMGGSEAGMKGDAGKKFKTLINDYLAKGGGVFLMGYESNHGRQHVADLSEDWGAKATAERFVEENKENIGQLTNASYRVPLYYTDNILPSPVSKGVKGIWYPGGHYYNGSATEALVLTKEWQPVVKASKTAMAMPLKSSGYIYGDVPKGVITDRGKVPEPTIFAIRDYKKGRIAMIRTMQQFSVGSGTGFIFNREVLSKGVNGKPSDYGRLLDNTYRWLAEPSLKSKAVGGYTTRYNALVPRNFRDGAKELIDYNFWYKEYLVNQWHVPPAGGHIYKGLIGARTAFSDGKGTVREYADAAQKAGLDFVVFLENFSKLSKKNYDKLVAECKKYSTNKIKLLPGFTAKTNIGNHTMCMAENGFWPKDSELTGPNKKILNMQPLNPKTGKFSGYNSGSCFNFQLSHARGPRNIGYYNWKDSGRGMRMPFQRLVAAAGIRYYKDGKLVEDMTDEYLTTAMSTMAPSPVSVNEVYSPEELIKEVKSGNALTYVKAANRHRIMKDGLKWTNTYSGLNVFLSDGPIIHDWPTCYRPMTFGAEEFVTIPAVMKSKLRVTSDKGLKEIKIYDARNLFRRFKLNGEKEFNKTLILNGTIMKNLIVIAEDIDGGKAISFPRRSYKYDKGAMSYCSDHVNDYGNSTLRSFHGPGPMPVCSTPELPIEVAGYTWDGGPKATVPLIDFQRSQPILKTDKGDESGHRFNQYPITETQDEGLMAVASRQEEVFRDEIERITNCWHVFGPHGDPSKLMEYTLRFKEYFPATVGPQGSDVAVRGVRIGIRPCVFTDEITFKQNCTIKQLTLLQNNHPPKMTPVSVIIGRKPDKIEKVLDVEKMKKEESFHLKAGDWIGIFSPKTSNSNLFVIEKDPVILKVRNYLKYKGRWIYFLADIAGKQVKKGDTFTFEMLSLNASMNIKINEAEQLRKLRSYLHNPENMKTIRGKRLATPGFLDMQTDNYAIEIELPKPSENLDITVPLRIPGLNRKWTVGMLQKDGYVLGKYGSGKNRYRGVGLDFAGNAHIPLYPDKAEKTHILAGHPIVADENGKDLTINVMHIYDNPHQWYIAVNNTTDKPISTKLSQAMELPGLEFGEMDITVQPGEHKELKW